MIDPLTSKTPGITSNPGVSIGGTTSGSPATQAAGSFADVLKGTIDEVAKLQADASQATQDLLTGRTEDITGVFAAMEKSDIAFKTLLSIRGKLMDAYDEIKNMPI